MYTKQCTIFTDNDNDLNENDAGLRFLYYQVLYKKL
jgi:hypothetical protein